MYHVSCTPRKAHRALLSLIVTITAMFAGSPAAHAQEVHLLAGSNDGQHELYATSTGDIFLNETFLGNGTTATRWSWDWRRSVRSLTGRTQSWTQHLDYFNSANITGTPIFGSYTSSLVEIGSHPRVFIVPVANIQYMFNYTVSQFSPVTYYESTFVDASGRVTPRFTDDLDTQRFGQIYVVLNADTGQFVDFFCETFTSAEKPTSKDLNYFYYIKSQSYTFTPENPVAGRSAMVLASNITIVNNKVGTPDTITVAGLAPGEVIKVYRTSSGMQVLGTGTVAEGANALTISVTQLGTAAGIVYVSRTQPGKLESFRTLKSYLAEPLNTNRAPIANAGPDQTVEATSPAGAAVTLDGSASTDPDGNAITWTWTGSFGTATGAKPTISLPVGQHTLTLTVSDGKLSATDTVVIRVVDTTAPTLTLPGNMIVEATGPEGAVVTYSGSASDLVSGSLPVGFSPASGSLFPLGVTTVTGVAQDAAGNLASGTFTVTVVDTTPPAIVSPGNLVVDSTSAAGAIVTYSATATDIVSSAVTVMSSHGSGSLFPIGVTTVTLTATDAAGNTSTTSFTITVLSPAQQLENLKDLVTSLPLSANEIAALMNKLEAATKSLEKGNESAAAGQLGAFVNQINALIQSGRLSAAAGQLAVDQANNMINQLR